MSGPIQLVAPGLLGLLQLKQGGSNPSQLSDTVAGVIELRDWYMQARMLDEVSLLGSAPATPVVTTGTGAGIQAFNIGGVNQVVPNGQAWYIDMMSASVAITTAADTIVMSLCISNNLGQNTLQVGPPSSDVITARARVAICRSDRGFWMHPGDKFLLMIHDILSVGGYSPTLRFRATPCQL